MACWYGSSPPCFSRPTSSRSLRFWESPWCDSPRPRWRSRGIGIDDMKKRTRVIGADLILIGLPVVLALSEAVSFHARNRNNGSIVSSGQMREYLLYVPPSYDRSRPTPLVISMHCAAVRPTQQMNLTDWNRLAESQRFIVVYPSGIE